MNTQRLHNALTEAAPYLPVTPDQLDTNPDLLNFTNGTVNLKTGELDHHKREDLITKLVHHDYDPEAECPVFLHFLEEIMGDAGHLVAYLQRALGYSLTGHTIEKAVFLLHGRGNNGKTTLLSLFRELLKEYSSVIQIETLMSRHESNNSNADLADLRGARFVMTSETREGQRLDEAKLKRITQGMGSIKAIRKYENPITFPETHKIWIDPNHLPAVRGDDHAIWNRLHPVPFAVTIAKENQDPELLQKLLGESEGVLAWAAKGAKIWYVERLPKPTAVEEAGQRWRTESDQTGRFVAQCCVTLPNCQIQARKLYTAYREWAAQVAEQADTETAFGRRMTDELGFEKFKDGVMFYRKIGLLADRKEPES